MNSPPQLLLCIIWCATAASPLRAQTDEGLLTLHNHQQPISHNASVEDRSNGITGAWASRHHQYYKHRSLRTVHGAVNIMGWGVLLPSGAIVARYLRETTGDWYRLHVLSQLSGFVLGSLGWGVGIFLKKQHRMSTHGILGTVIFGLATLQLLGGCLQQEESRRCWAMCHSVVGYALIALIVANIFEGISNHNAPKRWDLVYGAVLGVLSITALALEALRWN